MWGSDTHTCSCAEHAAATLRQPIVLPDNSFTAALVPAARSSADVGVLGLILRLGLTR